MNLQEIQALPLIPSTQQIAAPDNRFSEPVSLSQQELAEALQKADAKSANLLQTIALPESEPLRQLILELIAVNREIELTEAKYRKAATEEVHALAARITSLQNHKTRLSTTFITTLNT